jgi:heme exporter protein B
MVEAVALPLWILFFNVAPGTGLLGVVAVVILASAGFTAAGTVFAAMTVRTRYAELLLPVLLLPFLVPSVFFAAQATARILVHRPFSELLGWLKLLAAFDLVFLTLATLLFPAVMDE